MFLLIFNAFNGMININRYRPIRIVSVRDKGLFYSFSTWICNTGNSINRTIRCIFIFSLFLFESLFAFVSKANWNLLFFAYYLTMKKYFSYQGKRKKVYKRTKNYIYTSTYEKIYSNCIITWISSSWYWLPSSWTIKKC